MHRVHVVHLQPAREILAEARPAEHGLDQHGPFEQAAEGERDDGEELAPGCCRNAWRQITCRRDSALARAAMMYSWLSCSSMKLRVMRLI